MTGQGIPAAVGRYQILDILGRGSMGVVYRAHDPVIGREVAIKVVHIDAENTEQHAASIARFRQEVQAAGRCNHPAIVGIFDFLDQDGDPAIVMERVDGTSLQRELRNPDRRAAVSVPEVLLQVLDALEYAHGLGIIHRDIKPANILLTRNGKVKIADFGIARIPDSTTATQVGLMLGTPSYMAPEQVSGDKVDCRSDLFAVAAILYESLTGKPPFTGTTITETILRLSGPKPVDLAPVSTAGGEAFVGILRQALAKDPAGRFQTAGAFALALRAVSADGRAEDQQATVVVAARPARTWDPAFLQQLERQLARFTGPMARVTVLQAADRCHTPEELYATIARGLPNAVDRGAFLRAVGGGRVEPSLGGTRLSGTASLQVDSVRPRTLGQPPAIPPEATAAAQAALVVHTGPIARMLVRDAASQATSNRDFIERLCAHVTRPDELAILRRRLRAEVEPKLPRS